MAIDPSLPLPMMGAFTFDGKSSLDFALVCKTIARPLIPPVKFRRVEYGTRSGAYDLPSTNYELRTVSVKLQYIGTKQEEISTAGQILTNANNPNHLLKDGLVSSYFEMRTRAREIAYWLCKPDWKQLTFDDEPGRYYLAKVDGEVAMDELEQNPLGGAEVNFICQPFAYADTVTSINRSGSTTFSVNNIGTCSIGSNSPIGSQFTISIQNGSGLAVISLNGRTLTTNYPTNIVIDNVLCEAKTTAGDNLFSSLVAGSIDKFLELIPGNNSITISGLSGGIVNVSFRAMWL